MSRTVPNPGKRPIGSFAIPQVRSKQVDVNRTSCTREEAQFAENLRNKLVKYVSFENLKVKLYAGRIAKGIVNSTCENYFLQLNFADARSDRVARYSLHGLLDVIPDFRGVMYQAPNFVMKNSMIALQLLSTIDPNTFTVVSLWHTNGYLVHPRPMEPQTKKAKTSVVLEEVEMLETNPVFTHIVKTLSERLEPEVRRQLTVNMSGEIKSELKANFLADEEEMQKIRTNVISDIQLEEAARIRDSIQSQLDSDPQFMKNVRANVMADIYDRESVSIRAEIRRNLEAEEKERFRIRLNRPVSDDERKMVADAINVLMNKRRP